MKRMAETIFNLFALVKDPLLVRETIGKHYSGASFDTVAGDWKSAEVTSRGLLRKKTLVSFNHDPSYYSDPGWSRQLEGMAGFFSRCEPNGRQQMVVGHVIPRFVFSIACIYHEEPSRQDYEFLGELCQRLDGFIFSGHSLLDACGNCVLRVDGYSDPEASFPASLYTPPPQEPVSPEQVRSRCLALGALVMRGVLERDLESLDTPEDTHRRLLEWVKEQGIDSYLEPEEADLIGTAPGCLDQRQAIDALWQVEGLEVLLWALGLKELPSCDSLSDVDTPLKLVGIWKHAIEAPVAGAQVRPVTDLEKQQAIQLTIHWRLREHGLRPKHMNLPEFVQKATFGPLCTDGVPLVDGDLALGGQPLNEVDDELLGVASSIANERHRAANWLMWGGSWCETDTAT